MVLKENVKKKKSQIKRNKMKIIYSNIDGIIEVNGYILRIY